MASRRPADWRFPSEKQARAEETLRQMQQRSAPPPTPAVGPADPMPEGYWDAVLSDPVARARPGVPIQNRRLSEIPRHVLRLSCRRCDRTVEIQTVDAVKLYGEHAIWKEIGMKLLDDGCQMRTGVREDDGCWPAFDAP
jgi:hypothetical protein